MRTLKSQFYDNFQPYIVDIKKMMLKKLLKELEKGGFHAVDAWIDFGLNARFTNFDVIILKKGNIGYFLNFSSSGSTIFLNGSEFKSIETLMENYENRRKYPMNGFADRYGWVNHDGYLQFSESLYRKYLDDRLAKYKKYKVDIDRVNVIKLMRDEKLSVVLNEDN